MQERLDFARALAGCLGGVSVSFVGLETDVFSASIQQSIYARLPGFQEKNMVSFLEKMTPKTVYLVAGMLDLSYGVIRLGNGYLSVGPCFTNGFSESRIRTHLRALRLSGTAAEQMLSQVRQIPVLSKHLLRSRSA